jgi:hypothetical protein
VDLLSYAKMSLVVSTIVSVPLLLLVGGFQGAQGALGMGLSFGLLLIGLVVNAVYWPFVYNLVSGWWGGLAVDFRRPVELSESFCEVRSVGLLSVLKVGAVAGLLLGAIRMLLVLGAGAINPGSSEAYGGSLGSLALFPLLGAVGGPVAALLVAVLYNGVARLVGGVKISLPGVLEERSAPGQTARGAAAPGHAQVSRVGVGSLARVLAGVYGISAVIACVLLAAFLDLLTEGRPRTMVNVILL